MGNIHRLPDTIIKQIAAGEVIERPASAVKELIENAIDASASEIDIEIRHGGKEYIKVVDNGTGILSEDVPLVFEKHSTSKISHAEDLRSIVTLGFRGEALHAIAFASKKVILTTKHEKEKVGTRIILENGQIKDISMFSRTVGTTVEVYDLFANLPARRKFLKSPAFETRKIVDVVFRYIFGYPHKKISLIVDNRKKISVIGKTPEHFYYAYVGRKPDNVITNSIKGKNDTSGDIWLYFDTINYQPFLYISVNGRPITGGSVYGLCKSILREVYGTQLLPSAVLWLWLPPGVVDPNIHPAKLEVDVKDKALVRDLILTLLRKNESTHRIISPSSAIVEKAKKQENLVNNTFQSTVSVIKLFSPEEEKQMLNSNQLVEVPKIIEVIDDTFVIYRYNGIKIADKHALMEGILFNILWNRKDKHIQSLTIPWIYEVRNPEELKDKLERLGFEVSVLSENSIAVRGVPSLLSLRIWNKELMGYLISDIEKVKIGRNKIADIACKLSVKAGDKNSDAFLQNLIKIGEEYPEYGYDPHGRPAIIKLDAPVLEKLFKRR